MSTEYKKRIKIFRVPPPALFFCLKLPLIASFILLICRTALPAGGAFTALPPSALAAGLGYISCSFRGEPSALEENPASLAGVEGITAQFSYRDYYSLNLMGHSWAGLAVPVGRSAAMGFSLSRMGTSRRVDFMDYSEEVFSLGLGGDTGFVPGLKAGGAFSFYRVDSRENASGFGFSCGVTWNPQGFRELTLGASLKNLNSPRIEWTTGASDILAPEASVSAGYAHPLGFSGGVGYNGLLRAGLQYDIPGEMLSVRAGYRDLDDYTGSISGGISVYYRGLRIDYAAENHAALGLSHLFTVNVSIERI